MSKKTFLGKKKCEMSHWQSTPLHSEYRMKILVRFLDFEEKKIPWTPRKKECMTWKGKEMRLSSDLLLKIVRKRSHILKIIKERVMSQVRTQSNC